MTTEGALYYIANAGAHTGTQLLAVSGLVLALAVVLWFVSQGIRGMASSSIGMAYYYIVAPGVICHETGHALGCILTGTKIVKFVPFHPTRDGTLGYISHIEPKSGVLGGITSGMPLVVRAAFKPTPSIAREQKSVSLSRSENAPLVIQGRHDPCIVPRAVPVVEAVVACVVLDMMVDSF